MSNKPILARDIYDKYVSVDGLITLPDDETERKLIARALLGKELASKFDYWLSYSFDLIYKEPDEKRRSESAIFKKENYFHESLKLLTDDQKLVVQNLVREISTGLLFSSLVTFDQSDFGDYYLSMLERKSGVELNILPNPLFDLHDELNDWIISFSKYGDEILELIEIKGGWQFKAKEFYSKQD